MLKFLILRIINLLWTKNGFNIVRKYKHISFGNLSPLLKGYLLKLKLIFPEQATLIQLITGFWNWNTFIYYTMQNQLIESNKSWLASGYRQPKERFLKRQTKWRRPLFNTFNFTKVFVPFINILAAGDLCSGIWVGRLEYQGLLENRAWSCAVFRRSQIGGLGS